MKDIRFRTEKYTKKIISEELYQKWINQYPEYSKYSYKDFVKFWELLANKYTDSIVINPNGVTLYSNMGEVVLKYTDSSDTNRNYKNSNIVKDFVKHLNFISSGKNGKIVWSVAYARKINSELPLIGFQACRNFTIKAGKAFHETPELFKISRSSKINTQAKIYKYSKNE